MANAKDDASTEIERVASSFAKAMGNDATDLLRTKAEEAGKGGKSDEKDNTSPTIIFLVGKAEKGGFRTPAEQAAEVAAGRSWSCWSAHMADKARDLVMKVDGKTFWEIKKLFGSSSDAFEKLWGTNLKKYGLVNAAGKDGWYEGDGFHVELPHSKIAREDERAMACLTEYVRLTRGKGGKPNDKFEKKHAALLAPLIKAAEKGGGGKK